MQPKSSHKVSAIVCAAGKGERAGFSGNKLLAPLYDAPALYYTLEKFDLPEVHEVIVAVAACDLEEISALCKPFGYRVTVGGKTRSESVKRALGEVTGDIVLIHDGARPFLSRKLILDCIESVERYGSGVCALPFTDTAIVAKDGKIVRRTDRDELFAVQTPQGFYTEEIRRAYELAGDGNYTDDSAVYGEFIAPAHLVAGEPENRKLTFRIDFEREPLPRVSLPAQGDLRVGTGVDVHAFGEGTFVTLAGVKIACDGGLVAHSDGDVVYHAVMDALLSAAGLKDIGHYFPDTDDAYLGADSGILLQKTVSLVRAEGFTPVNLSVSVQAERPRLAPHIDGMRRNLSERTGVPAENVAVAAGTCEKLGFVGKGAGIAATCTVLLRRAEAHSPRAEKPISENR